MGLRAVERSDVGVPAWWVDGDDDPCEAWLLFRVGIADETLLTRGITRLALQVARTGVRHHDVDLDLVVEGAFAGFHLTGDPEDVAEVVAELGRCLVTPPPSPSPRDRLEQARHDLLVSFDTRPLATGGLDAAIHFGATDYGLLGFDEFGLSSLDEEAVRAWTQRHLVGGNAVMAWSCRPPDHLAITLPWGPRLATPRPIPTDLPTPRYQSDLTQEGWAAVSLRVGEGLAGAVAARMVVRRLREGAGTMLRQRRTGVTPKVVLVSHPVLDGRTEVWNISCDGRPTEQSSAQLVFDTAWLLADEGTSRRELRAVAADLKAELADENRIVLRALHAAVGDLLASGQPPDHRQPDLVADLHPEAVRLAWIDALATAVWLVSPNEDAPEGTGLAGDELVPMPKKGTRYRAFDPADPTEIVLGEHVVAAVTSPTTGTVVPFRSCEGLIDLDGGVSMIVSTNGESFVIDPRAWIDGHQLLAAVHERVPADLQARSADPTATTSDLDFG